MAIKLDLANAFDRLRHSFVILVLKSFGFPETFILQVQACITSPWIAPLINGRPSTFFKASRGVRQGCPLSPFLYILVADSLSRRLNRLHAEGSLPGLSFRGSVPPINHALFTDDTILLGVASPQIARNFLRPLDNFLSSSGSSVNFQKSQIFGWNCPPATLCSISQILKIKANPNWTHFTYLGIPVVKKTLTSSMWNPVIQKIKDKIHSLGSKWLNLAGKTVLIKSILSSYPIYLSSMVLAPRNVIISICKELRKFLWQGGKVQTKKFHLVKWETV